VGRDELDEKGLEGEELPVAPPIVEGVGGALGWAVTVGEMVGVSEAVGVKEEHEVGLPLRDGVGGEEGVGETLAVEDSVPPLPLPLPLPPLPPC
jgi:hypothetical protein